MLNSVIFDNLADAQGVYVLLGDNYRHFVIEDFTKYSINRESMVNKTNKLLLSGEKISKKGLAKKRKIATDYVGHFNNITTDYGLSFKPSSLDKWKDGVTKFNILDTIPQMKSGFLKQKNIVLTIKEGEIDGSLEKIAIVSSSINQRFIKTFDEVFEYIKNNPNSEYDIDVLEFSPKTGIFAQYHFIYDLTKDIMFLRGKTFIISFENTYVQ